MSKEQFHNLYHTFRTMRRACGVEVTLAWIGFYSFENEYIIQRIVQ